MTQRPSTLTKSRTRVNKASFTTNARKPDTARRPGGKPGLILVPLADKTGTTPEERIDATGWQKPAVYGAQSQRRTGGFAIDLDAKFGRAAYRRAGKEA